MVGLVAIENVLLAAVSVFALALTVIAIAAFRRTRDPHLLFLVTAFAVFFLKSLLLTVFIFSDIIGPAGLFLLTGFLDLAILTLFYGFTLRR